MKLLITYFLLYAFFCLGPGYDNGKENWRILTNKEIHAILKYLPQQRK
jgi:hypothetical protein